MNEEGDVPTVSEAVQSTPMESVNEELAPKTDKPQQEPTDSRKTTQSTRLIRRLGSLTGITKSKAKVTTESTEEIVALQIKVSQLTNELEESRSEIDRCKRESEDVTERAKRESDEIRSEFDRYNLESQFEKKSLMTKMENDDKLKSVEFEMLKIANLKTEAERETLITKMECDAKILKRELEDAKCQSDNLNYKLEANRVEIDRSKRESDEKAIMFSQLENEVKLMSAEIGNLKVALLKTETERDSLISKMECEANSLKKELKDATASSKRESDKLKERLDSNRAEINQCKIALRKTEEVRDSLITKMEYEAKLKYAEIENLKRESEAAAENANREMDHLNEKLKAYKIERDQYKRESDEDSSLLSQLQNEVESKSAEIENLKAIHLKTEAESKSRISQMEGKLKLKSAEIQNLKISADVRSGLAKVEKNLSSLLNRTTDMTIRAKFVVSKLTEYPSVSHSTEFAGMNWSIDLRKLDDHLAFYLDGLNTNNKPCPAFFKFQLISQKCVSIVHSKNPMQIHVYDDESTGWGYDQFISFKDLLDEKKGYVKDDSIIVAAVIKAFPAN